MMTALLLEEFKQKEQDKLTQTTWLKSGILALIGAPSVITGATEGAAIGGAIGLPFGGIGAIPGATIGLVIGAAIGFIGAGILTYLVVPKANEWLLKAWRRISEGDFDFRYNKFLSTKTAESEFEKLIEIAVQIKRLKKYGLIKNSTETNMYIGLTESQEKLVKELLNIVESCNDETDPVKNRLANIEKINRNKYILEYKSKLAEEIFNKNRSAKIWAEATLEKDPQDSFAQNTFAGISAGRPAWFIFNLLLHPFSQSTYTGLVESAAPQRINPQIALNIKEYPHLAVKRGDELIWGLLQMDMDKIEKFGFAAKQRFRYYEEKLPQELDKYTDEIQLQIHKAEIKKAQPDVHYQEELNFAKGVQKEVKAWFDKPVHGSIQKSLTDMSSVELKEYLERLIIRERNLEQDKAKQEHVKYKIARVKKLISQKFPSEEPPEPRVERSIR